MGNFRKTLLASAALALVISACGGTVEASVDDDDDPAGVTTGRVIEVSMTEFAFSPAPIEVNEGETVTFVVTNDGVVDHEFRLANDELVEAHEHDSDHEDTDDMEMMSVLLLAPGETGELVVTFDHDATFTEVTCLLPGHREAGMVTPLAINE